MSDPANRETDRIIAEIEARIKVEYAQAEREIADKAAKYYQRFEWKDKKWQEWVRDQKKTQKEYDDWRVGQMAMGERWEEMRKTIAQDLLNTSKIARSIANGYKPEVYALNHDYGTFEVEHGSQLDTSYTLYSREAAERLFRSNPQMLPAPGRKVSQDIADGKAMRWNNQHIQSVAMQAILQGNSIPDIAQRLSNTVADDDMNAAIRNARTMMTAAQNAGRVDSYTRANAMGIKTRKQWLATLDSRTRHEHRELDGQTVDNDEPFRVGGFEINYPGDPEAAPSLVFNCFPGEMRVSTDSEIQRSYRHWYEGELIEIKCASGLEFSCTPNHPILCPCGWVKANAFNEGDDILVAFRGDGAVPGGDPDIDHVFASFKAVHDLAVFLFGRAERIRPLGVNFHGDVPTSDVEVISKERFLRKDGNPGLFKSAAKFLFKLSDTLALCKSHLMESFRSIDISPFGFVGGGGKPRLFFWRSVCHPGIHGFGSVADMDAVLPEYTIDNLPTETVIRSELLNGLSGKVFADHVISVKRSVFKGHVYNLQTKNGYYFVSGSILPRNERMYNGISAICKNCRCTLIASIAGYERDLSDISLRHNSRLGDMTYEEWKESKKEKSRPIDSQKKLAESYRRMYIREYKEDPNAKVGPGWDTTLSVDALKGNGAIASPSLSGDDFAPMDIAVFEKAMDEFDYAEYMTKIEDHPIVRGLYERYGEQVELEQGEMGLYYPGKNKIEFRYNEGMDGINKYSTLAHEMGHFFDDKMGRYYHPELSWIEVDSINKEVGAGKYFAHTMLRPVPSNSDAFLFALREDMEALKPKILSNKIVREMDGYRSRKFWSSNAMMDAAKGFYGTVEGRSVWMGHTDAYYDDWYNTNINGRWEDDLKKVYDSFGLEGDISQIARHYSTACETFASICSAYTVGGLEEASVRHFLPRSCEIFEMIMEKVNNE